MCICEKFGLRIRVFIHWFTLLKTLPYKDVLHHIGVSISGMYIHDMNIVFLVATLYFGVSLSELYTCMMSQKY